MCTLEFHRGRFLRFVYGTKPFVEYCQERRIPFAQEPDGLPTLVDLQRWAEALARLSPEEQLRVEMDLARVHALVQPDAIRLIVEAVDGRVPADQVGGGAPLALWFYLHRREVFDAVFFRQEIRDLDGWQTGRGPNGVSLSAMPARAAALTESLRRFFRVREGTGRFCVVDAYRLGDAVAFDAQVADRLRTVEAFSEAGALMLHRLRPALRVVFVYDPAEGTILLRSHLRARQRLLELYQLFGRSVLRVVLGEDCLADTFDLDVLKREFLPLPDAPDMERIRIKSLCLRYPERAGRRQVKLETLASDTPSAVRELLRVHGGDDAVFEQLRVCHAELQVILRVNGRAQSHVIRLWANRSNLSRTATGERLRACLRRWGLSHVPQP